MLPTQKKKKDFVNPNENEFLFFPEKKKKENIMVLHQHLKKKKKHRKLPAIVIQLKYAALRVYTKLSNYTALHLLLACFIILVIPPVFFPRMFLDTIIPLALK